MASSRNRPPLAALPDIDDELFKARLKPLADSVLPRSVAAPQASSGPTLSNPAVVRTEPPMVSTPPASEAPHQEPSGRKSSMPDNRISGDPAYHALPFGAAQVIEQTRAARGPRRGVEFLLPERVVAALRVQAAESGMSLSVKLLEILRNAGYPVIDEDFVDIRKLPKR
jgi:hypothetical protein